MVLRRYLRQAAPPKLEAIREGGALKLRWVIESGAPFPLPVDVDRCTVTVPMTGGVGEVALSNTSAFCARSEG